MAADSKRLHPAQAELKAIPNAAIELSKCMCDNRELTIRLGGAPGDSESRRRAWAGVVHIVRWVKALDEALSAVPAVDYLEDVPQAEDIRDLFGDWFPGESQGAASEVFTGWSFNVKSAVQYLREFVTKWRLVQSSMSDSKEILDLLTNPKHSEGLTEAALIITIALAEADPSWKTYMEEVFRLNATDLVEHGLGHLVPLALPPAKGVPEKTNQEADEATGRRSKTEADTPQPTKPPQASSQPTVDSESVNAKATKDATKSKRKQSQASKERDDLLAIYEEVKKDNPSASQQQAVGRYNQKYGAPIKAGTCKKATVSMLKNAIYDRKSRPKRQQNHD